MQRSLYKNVVLINMMTSSLGLLVRMELDAEHPRSIDSVSDDLIQDIKNVKTTEAAILLFKGLARPSRGQNKNASNRLAEAINNAIHHLFYHDVDSIRKPFRMLIRKANTPELVNLLHEGFAKQDESGKNVYYWLSSAVSKDLIHYENVVISLLLALIKKAYTPEAVMSLLQGFNKSTNDGHNACYVLALAASHHAIQNPDMRTNNVIFVLQSLVKRANTPEARRLLLEGFAKSPGTTALLVEGFVKPLGQERYYAINAYDFLANAANRLVLHVLPKKDFVLQLFMQIFEIADRPEDQKIILSALARFEVLTVFKDYVKANLMSKRAGETTEAKIRRLESYLDKSHPFFPLIAEPEKQSGGIFRMFTSESSTLERLREKINLCKKGLASGSAEVTNAGWGRFC